MTVEEKRHKLNNYCEKTDCSECVLLAHDLYYWENPCIGQNCLRIDCSPEEDLDKALALIDKVSNPIKPDYYNDNVNRPAHYTDGKIEVIDYIEDKKLGFCLGNAIKYISRAGKKDPTKEVEDLNKAIWYINRRIKEIQEETKECIR